MKTLQAITRTTAIELGNRKIDFHLFFAILWGMLSSVKKNPTTSFAELNLVSDNYEVGSGITELVPVNDLVEEINETVGGKIVDLPSAVNYYKQLNNIADDPIATFTLRLISGGTRFNMEKIWNELQNSGLTGSDLVLTFWDNVSSLIGRYMNAYESPKVLNYIANNTTSVKFENGITMISVKGDTDSDYLDYFQRLAVEGHLIKNAGNDPILITFQVPGTVGLTPFFGNQEAVAKFNSNIVAELNQLETLYKDDAGNVWSRINNVTFAPTGSFALNEAGPEAVNKRIEMTTEQAGKFTVENPISVN